MRSYRFLLIFLLFAACKPGRKVNTSFYYWKTVYKQSNIESAYLNHLHSHKLYVRITDVDMADDGVTPVPVSPIIFQSKLPDTLQIVPVVFIVNEVLKNATKQQLSILAQNLYRFVTAKVKQGSNHDINELQIDCDWTKLTRENYFYLLRQLKHLLINKQLSVTLRLHQLKNQQSSGVPPADKVLLMCYNMGNLRKYGNQNSIIQLSELKKYAGDNLASYPMPMDIALPLFSWAVAFRNKDYIGIDKRINFNILNDQSQFLSNGNNIYSAKTDMPAYGLHKGDEVRWEDSALADVQEVAAYIGRYLKPGDVNVVYFHLDEDKIKNYKYEGLENIAHLLR